MSAEQPEVKQEPAVEPRHHRFIEIGAFRAHMQRRARLLPRAVPPSMRNPLPHSATLQKWCPPAYNQEYLGSCTANAIAHTILITSSGATWPPPFEPSRMFIYWNELVKMGQTPPLEDTGADAADGCEIINRLGVCSEEKMPYIVDPATHEVLSFNMPPSPEAIAEAAQHCYPMFSNLTNNGPLLHSIKRAIVSRMPVMLAFEVFPSFESKEVEDTGLMPMPSTDDFMHGVVGGHEVVVVGYQPGSLICLNSWGPRWGRGGAFLMPAAYLTGQYGGWPFVQQILTLQPIHAPVQDESPEEPKK